MRMYNVRTRFRLQRYKEFLAYTNKKTKLFKINNGNGLFFRVALFPRGIKIQRFLLNGQIGGENSLIFLDFA